MLKQRDSKKWFFPQLFLKLLSSNVTLPHTPICDWHFKVILFQREDENLCIKSSANLEAQLLELFFDSGWPKPSRVSPVCLKSLPRAKSPSESCRLHMTGSAQIGSRPLAFWHCETDCPWKLNTKVWYAYYSRRLTPGIWGRLTLKWNFHSWQWIEGIWI